MLLFEALNIIPAEERLYRNIKQLFAILNFIQIRKKSKTFFSLQKPIESKRFSFLLFNEKV